MLSKKQIEGLIDFFEQNQTEFVGTIETVTTVKLNKKDVATKTKPNPFKEIRKVQTANVVFNADYERRVNEARVTEGVVADFEATKRAWGVPVGGRVVVKHDDQFYINYVELAKVGDPIYIDSDMNPIMYDAFKEFVPAVSKSANQGVEKEVKFRSVKTDNIRSMKFKGSDAIFQ